MDPFPQPNARVSSSRITRGLQEGPPWLLTAYAVVAAFSAYFCMYAFRKPFAAAKFSGEHFLDTEVTLKTALVIAQIAGYTLSKYAGIRVLSGLSPRRRPVMLGGLIVTAWAALLLFGFLPGSVKLIAIFINGLSLGMVWGLVVGYLEGRRTSEILLAGLSCSFIVASGAVKDVGRFLMREFGVTESWMPFATGALFVVPFFVAVALLSRIPAPSEEDERLRSKREAMDSTMRASFVRTYWIPLTFLLVAYFFLTAFRDFRDNYGVELFSELGYADEPAVFTFTELPVAFGVMLVMALLSLVRDNALALKTVLSVMALGVGMLGVATMLLDVGVINGVSWMILLGLGSYLAYVPFGSVLFDRMFSYTRAAGTAVFAIYIADAIGYTGSVLVQLYKDLLSSDSHLEFFRGFTSFMAGLGALAFVGSSLYFVRSARA